MRPVLLPDRDNSAKESQALSRDNKLHRDRLVSRLATEGPGIRLGKVSTGTRFFFFFLLGHLVTHRELFHLYVRT